MKTIYLFVLSCFLGGSIFGQVPDTEIYLIPFWKEGEIKSDVVPKNVTNRPGYDNQPWFMPDGKSILYTSIRADNQADIYQYVLATGEHRKLTHNPLTSEYSPVLMPDGKAISVVQVEKDGVTQRIWHFPLDGGVATPVQVYIKKVGYYTWISEDQLAMFIVGDNKTPHALHIAGVKDTASYTVAAHIGRAIHKVPDEKAVSFVHKLPDNKWLIKKLDLESWDIQTIIPALPESEDYCWSADGTLWMGSEGKLYKFKPGVDTEWELAVDLSYKEVKDFYRLAISPDGKWLAVVAYKGEKP